VRPRFGAIGFWFEEDVSAKHDLGAASDWRCASAALAGSADDDSVEKPMQADPCSFTADGRAPGGGHLRRLMAP
jgi:hypothetical protein